MVFSSILFLFRFFPIAFLVYYLVPAKLKNLALLILSLFFYGWGEVKYLPIMFASMVIDYCCGQGIKRLGKTQGRKRLFLVLSVVLNLGLLFFFKYTNFFVDLLNSLGASIPELNITLPLGISFYTFQTMSYTIDVYRGKVEAEDNFITFGAFVVLFPQLIAGPIVTYRSIASELKERRITREGLEDGVRYLIMGLASKVLIANNVGALWSEVSAFESISTPLAWIGALAYSLQIYFDFSGYSLMAIGMGKMMGFTFPKNFDFPYISKSITEFWRRWHMTLGSWFRDYLYIPLGGNRVSPGRQYFNLFVVWFCTGFWHGANWNFIIWGLYFLVLLILEKRFYLKKLEQSKVISHIYLIFFVMVSWVIFALTDFSAMGNYFVTLFAFRGGNDWIYYLRNYGVVLLLGIFFSTPLIKIWYERFLSRHQILKTVLLSAIFLVSVAYLVDATYNPFLYSRF